MYHFRWIIGTLLAFLIAAWTIASVMSLVGSSLFTDWRFVFQRFSSPSSFWGLVLIGGGCVAAMTALFRYEQQLVPLRLGLTLLALRVGLVVIIFLTLLQPVWTWSYDQKSIKRLLLALDVSESMETVDRQASQIEKIRWAEAIGIIGSPEARARAQQWMRDLQAGREPEWVPASEEADFQKRKQLSEVRRENLSSQLQELEPLSRLDILLRACRLQSGAPLQELEKLTRLQAAAVAEKSELLDLNQLKETSQLTSLQIGRGHSNLAEAANASRLGSQTAPLGGVVLLSDGHDTETKESAQLLSRLQGLGVPVHTVLVGSEFRPRDLSILQIDHPESVFLKDQSLVKAVLQTGGFEGESIRVFLDDLDTPDAAPLEQTLSPTGSTTDVSFTLKNLPIGRHRFRMRADVAPNESRTDNNSTDFSINVVDDRARILLVEGESRWEFRFLDAALTRDEQISVDHVLFEQPFLRVLRHPFFPTSLDELAPATDNGTPFAPYDLVLIGDVSPQNLNAARWQQLDRYVREEGGTLVLTAGKRFFPLAYQGTLAEALLPIEGLREVRVDNASQTGPPNTRGFRLSLGPDTDHLPMFQLDADPVRSKKIWSQLPGHMWGIVGTARGGANVWASVQQPDAVPSLEQERANGLIVQHYVGTGQVVWVGLDSTWRWRFLVGDLYHHRFWGQLLRWAVAFKASAGNEMVRFGLRETVIRSGETAFIQARWDQRFLARNPDLKADVVVTHNSTGFQRTVALTQRKENHLIFEGQAAGLPAGEYTLRLNVSGDDATQAFPEIGLIVNAELTPELRDVSANRALLEQIAKSTGGEFLQLNELDRLPALFEHASQTQRIREEIPVYSHWLILLLFSGVAMTEWVLRKLNGLP